MSRDEARDLLAAHALGMLPAEDAVRAESLAAADPALAAELQGHRSTVHALEQGLAREAPPPGLLDGILGEAAPVRASRPRRPFRMPRLALAGGFALVAVALVAELALRGGPGPAAEAAVAGEASAHGTARLYDPGSVDGELVVRLEDVPPPPAGHHYEVWVLRERAGAMEAVGAFARDGTVELELPLPGAGDYRAVDISVEEDGGDAGHSGTSLAGGSFR